MSGAVVIAKQNQLIRRFRQAAATCPKTALTLEPMRCRDSGIFRRVVVRGVFVEVKPGRYYIDEMAADEFVRMRRARMLWALAAPANPATPAAKPTMFTARAARS